MRVPSAPSRVVGLAKVPQRAYLDLLGATAWDISPVGSRGNLDLMQYALIFFDVQLILAQMPWAGGVGTPDGKVHGHHQFALTNDDHQENPINAGKHPVFLPTPPGAHQPQLLAILF